MSLTQSHIIDILKNISNKRFFRTERGYQGKLISAIEQLIQETEIFRKETIVEQEHQKTIKHHRINQRPDIIVHIPIEANLTNDPTRNNYYVIALKLNGNGIAAVEDYKKLNDMFRYLNYREGLFINIGTYPDIYLNNYRGRFRNKIHEVSIRLNNNGEVDICYARFYRNRLIISEI